MTHQEYLTDFIKTIKEKRISQTKPSQRTSGFTHWR